MTFAYFRTCTVFAASLISSTCLIAAAGPGGSGADPAKVGYNPDTKIIQGSQGIPLTYTLQITSPSNLSASAANPVTVNLLLSVLDKPAGVSDASALSFVTLSSMTVTFTAKSQARTISVTVLVPLTYDAGNYDYRIIPATWPATTNGISDGGSAINATVSPPGVTDTTPPAIILQSPANGQVFIYYPATGNPVHVPITFAASVGLTAQPIDTVLASVSSGDQSTSVSLTINGLLPVAVLPAFDVTASGSLDLTTPGNYSVSVGATNRNGSSYDRADFTVMVSAPPPTLTVSSPAANNPTYTYYLGGAGASVPVTFSATSIYGNITALAATLDGAPVTLGTSGVNSARTATGAATLTVNSVGSHQLVFSAANDYDSAQPVTIPFTVAGRVPAPTVSILAPAGGSVFTRNQGDPATLVNYSFQGGASYGTISKVEVTLDSVVVIPTTLTGVGGAAVSGAGTLSFAGGGSHTLNVKVTNNGGAVASAATSFAVNETLAQVCRDLTWLPPVSLNKTIEGGSTMPIKFILECHNKFVRDTTVLITIYEVFSDGSTSTPVIYPYGAGSANPPDYAITGNQYHLNFDTPTGTHSYQIEVYTAASGTLQLLGSKELNTTGKDCDRSNRSCERKDHSCDNSKGAKGDDHNGGKGGQNDDHSSDNGKGDNHGNDRDGHH